METVIHGSPSFSYLEIDLEPGESIISESDAMATMAADLDLKANFNGGFLKGLARSLLGGESLFINTFTNNSAETRRITLAQASPGVIIEYDLSKGDICLQPGAYVSSTTDARLGLKWAGFASGIGREGFFKLRMTGETGRVWFGAYGGILEWEIDGEYIIDTAHLVAYEPQIQLKVQLAGGIFSSLFGGEGLVTRVEGQGKIWIQTRSLNGLAGWLNPKLPR